LKNLLFCCYSIINFLLALVSPARDSLSFGKIFASQNLAILPAGYAENLLSRFGREKNKTSNKKAPCSEFSEQGA
jgi:hypothetical protein